MLRLDLVHPPIVLLGPEPVRLVAVFPDHYPFFPVHVEAPDLDLEHHQNPLAKNLCLLARSTNAWRPMADTLAGLLSEQLEPLLVAATSTPEAAAPLEEHVPEPATIYYPYEVTSAVLLSSAGEGSSGRVPAGADRGSFVLGLEDRPHTGNAVALRGALLAVLDDVGNVVLEAAPALAARYANRPRVTGRWARVERAVFADSFDSAADAVYHASEVADPRGPKRTPLELGDGRRLRVRAILFPEKRRWWGEADHLADGWAFAVRLYRVDPAPPGVPHAARASRAEPTAMEGGGLRRVAAAEAGASSTDRTPASPRQVQRGRSRRVLRSSP